MKGNTNLNRRCRCCDLMFSPFNKCNAIILDYYAYVLLWLCVGSIEAIDIDFFTKRPHISRTEYDGIAITTFLIFLFFVRLAIVSVHGIEYNWITKDGSVDRSSSEYNIPKRQQLSKTKTKKLIDRPTITTTKAGRTATTITWNILKSGTRGALPANSSRARARDLSVSRTARTHRPSNIFHWPRSLQLLLEFGRYMLRERTLTVNAKSSVLFLFHFFLNVICGFQNITAIGARERERELERESERERGRERIIYRCCNIHFGFYGIRTRVLQNLLFFFFISYTKCGVRCDAMKKQGKEVKNKIYIFVQCKNTRRSISNSHFSKISHIDRA